MRIGVVIVRARFVGGHIWNAYRGGYSDGEVCGAYIGD